MKSRCFNILGVLLAAMIMTKYGSGIAQAQVSSASATPSADQPQLVMQLGHADTINSVAISADGRHALTGSTDRTAILWELPSGRLIRRLNLHQPIMAVAFSPDERYAVTGSRGPGQNVQLWDLKTGQEIRRCGSGSYQT